LRNIYELKGLNNNNIFNPLATIAQNRGLSEEELKWHLSPTKVEHPASDLPNMEKGVNVLLDHIARNSSIFIVIDGDNDGYTSSAILVSYLRKAFNRDFKYGLHVNKKHGIEIDLIPEGTSLIIAPDSLSNETEIYEELAKKGIEVILLDHHEADEDSENAVIINPKLPSSIYPNTEISGAGMVYKFIQEVDKRLSKNYADYFLDLVSIGMVGDAMKISSEETKWLITKGLSQINNDFLKELVKKNLDDGIELTPTVLSFKLLPKINSLIRVGTQEDKMELFKAMCGHEEITINPKLRKPDKSETYGQRVARICNNTYAKQARMRDKIYEELKLQIADKNLDKNRIIVLNVESDFPENFTGYIASKVVGDYRKPVVVLRTDDKEGNEGFKFGSLRGYDPLIKDTKDFLESLNIFSTIGGHQQAAGVKIKNENIEKLNSVINEALYELDKDESYMVDLIMNAKSLNKEFVIDMSKYDKLWGKGLDQPMYAIEGLEINLSDSQTIGKTESILKFAVNGIEFIKFSDIGSLLDLKADGKTAVLNVVGKTGLNSFRGNITPQFVVDAIEIVEVKDSARFVF
jgi:single-stranded-DNA-specific exonuclease